MLKDPVCQRRISRNHAYVTIQYNGVEYYLCCPLCQAEFERKPEVYAQPELGERVKHPATKGHRDRP